MKPRSPSLPHWWVALAGVTLLILTRLALSGSLATHQHPHTFFTAAQMLWSGQDPYGVDLGYGRDYWFYSPFCGLFIYGLGLLIPRSLAAWSLAAIATVLFLEGVRRWAAQAAISAGRGWWLTLVLTSFLVSAISWHKLELLIVALELAAYLLLQRRAPTAAGVWLGLASQWKGLSLPIVGLLILVLRRDDRIVGFLRGFALSVAAAFLAPAWIVGWGANLRLHQHWLSSLQVSVGERSVSMENLYHAVGGGYPWLGLIAVAGLVLTALKQRHSIAWAFAAGAWFRVVFGPLHQNNAALLAAPFVLFETNLLWLAAAGGVLGFAYALEGFPGWIATVGSFARNHSLKSIFLFFWGIFRIRPLPIRPKA